jgi:hypothetical protein
VLEKQFLINQSDRMAIPRRFTWPTLCFTLVVTLFIWWLASNLNPQNTPQKLPDGTILTVVQVDYGQTNTLWEGSKFEKMFRRFIPAKGINFHAIQLNRPVALHTVTNSDNILVFWIKHSGTRLWNPVQQWQTGDALDELGNEVEIHSGATFTAGTNVYSVWQIPAFPRYGKTVRLGILPFLPFPPSSGGGHLAEFVARNPTPAPKSAWRPGAMPQTNQVGDTTFVLTDLEIGPSRARDTNGQARFPTFPYSKLSARATFVVLENGHSSSDWAIKVPSGRISDASGNKSLPMDTYTTSARPNGLNQLIYCWNFPLGTNETWKIEAEFYRCNGIIGLDVIGLPIPISGGPPPLWRTNIFGSELLVGIVTDSLMAELPDKPKDLFLAGMVAANDHGKKFQILLHGGEGPRTEYSMTLEIPRNSKTVDATIILGRKVLVEFIAKPRWVAAARDRPQ